MVSTTIGELAATAARARARADLMVMVSIFQTLSNVGSKCEVNEQEQYQELD